MLCIIYFFQFINGIVSDCTEKEARQPTLDDQKAAIVTFLGPVVSCRSFKQYAPRSLRSITEEEFKQAAGQLNAYGNLVTVRVPRSSKATAVFIKNDPQTIDWDREHPCCQQQQYVAKYSLPVHSSVTVRIRNQLVTAGHVPQEIFNM